MRRGADEYQTSRGDNRSTEVCRASVLYALCNKFRNLTQWHLPADFTCIQVDGVQRSPRRFDGRITIGIEKRGLYRRRVLQLRP